MNGVWTIMKTERADAKERRQRPEAAFFCVQK